MELTEQLQDVHWQRRAIAATRRNASRLGTILLCALNQNERGSFPQFIGRATVSSDGFITCNFIDRNGEGHLGAFVGALSDLVDNVNGLIAHLGLDDEEAAELRAVMRSWIASDYRPDARRGVF